MTTVLLFALLIWIPVFTPNLLSSWNLQPSLFFRQWITFNGLAGVFYFAVVAGKQHSGPFNWIKFVLFGFLGFATFGVATLGYSLYQLAQNENGRSNRFGHKVKKLIVLSRECYLWMVKLLINFELLFLNQQKT